MSPYVWTILAILFVALLLILTLLLLTRGRLWGTKHGVAEAKATVNAATDYPGIDPSEYADAAEMQAALDRLSQLPQFHRLTDGTLVEWGIGARVTACDCPLPPVPHLMISWGPNQAQGIVTRTGLAHYVAYQERVADVLRALLAVRIAPHEDAAGAEPGIALKGGR